MDVLKEKMDVLNDFQRFFFSMSRFASFPWTFLEKDLQSNKSSQFILDILKQTCLHSLCTKFPPSVKYRRLFISELIRQQEAAGCDPLDELYDALAKVLGAEDTPDCYKSYLLVKLLKTVHNDSAVVLAVIHYPFISGQVKQYIQKPCGDSVSLLENVALISEGTTGLVTWESGLYLAEWALDHQQAFTDRTVLELGSGLGLTGITICRSCSPNRFVFSDFHPSVLQKLRTNVRLNGLGEQTTPTVSVELLDWTTATEEQLQEIGADIIIAADVTYDPDILGGLVTILTKILRFSSPEVLICSSIRNPETYSGFKQQLENAGIRHHVVTGHVSHVFPYSRFSSIEMIKLYR